MYSTFGNIRNSLELAWKNKLLWIFAVILLAGGGGGSTYDNTYQDDETFEPPIENKYDYAPAAQNNNTLITLENDVQGKETFYFSDMAKEVKGAATSVLENNTQKAISPFSGIGFFIVVGITGLILFIYLIYIGLILRGWAKGSIVSATLTKVENKDYTLKSISSKTISALKNIINLQLTALFRIFGYILMPILLIILVGIIGALLNTSSQMLIVQVILGIVAFILSILGIIKVSIGVNYAYRTLMEQEVDYMDAFKSGLADYKNNKKVSLKLLFLNTFVAAAVLSPILILSGLIIFSMSAQQPESAQVSEPSFISITGGFLALMVFGILAQITSGFLGTQREFAWSTLYKHIHSGDVLESKSDVSDPQTIEPTNMAPDNNTSNEISKEIENG